MLPRMSAVALVAIALIATACTGSSTTVTPQPPQVLTQPVNAQLQSVPRYGAVCEVSKLRADFWGRSVEETAWVWRTPNLDHTCPDRGGDTYVGFGLDSTFIEQRLGPLECRVSCWIMGSPDVNGDGLAELAVGEGGADALFVHLFGVRRDHDRQRIVEYTVSPPGDPLVEAGALELAFSGSLVSADATCTTLRDRSPGLVIRGMVGDRRMRTAVLRLDGTKASVVAAWTTTVGLRHHPSPTERWCDRVNPVVPTWPALCDTSSMRGDVDGDGVVDVVTIGTRFGSIKPCPYDGHRRLLIDLGGDGSADIRTAPPDCTTWCWPFVIADMNADARGEILLNEGHLAAPNSAVIAVYELIGDGLEPIRFPDGSNRFQMQESWQGLMGAYCPDAWTFATWEANMGPLDRLRSITYHTYWLDLEQRRFTTARGSLTVRTNELPSRSRLGYDGRFCGLRVDPIG